MMFVKIYHEFYYQKKFHKNRQNIFLSQLIMKKWSGLYLPKTNKKDHHDIFRMKFLK